MVSSFFCALGKRQTFTKSHRKANFGKGIRRLQTVLFRAGSGSKTRGHPVQICDISLRHGSKQRFDTRVDWQYQGHPDASVSWVGQFPGESRPDDPQARAQCCQNHMETAASRRKAAARRAVPGKNRPIFPLAGWIPAANSPDKH